MILSLCILAGMAFFSFIKNNYLKKPIHETLDLDNNTKKNNVFLLGDIEELQNTRYALIPLVSEENSQNTYYSTSSKQSIRNYLLFDKKTKKEEWIWKNSNILVSQVIHIFKDSGSKSNTVVGLLFKYIDKDTNNDGHLNSNDRKNISYYQLSTHSHTPIVIGIDKVIGINQANNSEILLFYSKIEKYFFKSLTVNSGRATPQKEINLPKI